MIDKSKMFENEHTFAQFVRILGKGKTGSRNLTRKESEQAMMLILNNEVKEVQLGAFLMLMRYQEESGAELAGFVDACKKFIAPPQEPLKVDLDWSSYAGKSRQLPWYILSQFILAQNGYKILVHGSAEHTPGRIYTENVLQYLNIEIAQSIEHATQLISKNNYAYLPLKNFLPQLDNILNLKSLLGLRSPINTLTRLLNPGLATCSIQGVHHPNYKNYHQDASLLLKQPRMAVIKGDGGETEWNPNIKNNVHYFINGEATEEEWQPIFKKHRIKNKDLSLSNMVDIWTGNAKDEYAIGAITGTIAICLKTLGKTSNHAQSLKLANDLWSQRDKTFL